MTAKQNQLPLSQQSIILSPLLRKFLFPILLTLLGFSLAVYFYAVPYLKNLVYSLEERSIQTNLSNIQKLLESNYFAIEAYKTSVTESYKRNLKNITLFMETYLKNKYQQAAQGLANEDMAQWNSLEELRAFRYGQNDYVWVADYNGFYLSHPDPSMNMEDFSKVRDVFGNYVLMPLIEKALENGEGYHRFWWHRLGSDLPAEMLAYSRLFPEWEWVIGTGVYLDDLEAEILMRKANMIDELREILSKITIAKTGYMYIFDSWQNIIIHPDRDLENTDMTIYENPDTGNKLVNDLIAVSSQANNSLRYMWKRPGHPGEPAKEKIDWVTHVEGFDWYIVTSVYADELNTSSILLRNKILGLTVVVVILSILIVSLMMGRLLKPVRSLSLAAKQIEAGDLTVQCDVESKDEIGLLAKAFNSMVAQLRSHIEDLDFKVAERTKELKSANSELKQTIAQVEQRNWEITQFNQMAESLQACHSLKETYEVIKNSMQSLFHQAAGALYMHDPEAKLLVQVANWGNFPSGRDKIPTDNCRAVSNQKIYFSDCRNPESACGHVDCTLDGYCYCMPLLGQHEFNGLIYLHFPDSLESEHHEEREKQLENWHRLAISVTDHLSMAVANLKLTEKLQNLSVRDGLTGLFNRRYMKETLSREFLKAERSGKPVGVIILDVDFFKKFNDTYGHAAGDLVLVELAKTLTASVRKEDVVCRYGGEEFVIILPGPPPERAIQRAELIRQRVENEMAIHYEEHVFKVTISLGAAHYPENGESIGEVLQAADQALYTAKEAGRNRAVLAGAISQPNPDDA